MTTPQRASLFAAAGLALVVLLAWLGGVRIGKTTTPRSAAGGVEKFATSTAPHASLPAPGSAIEFDSLLALARSDLAAFTAWLAKHTAALAPEQRRLFLLELMRRWLAEWQAGAPGGIRDAFQRLAATEPETAGQLVALLPSVPLRHVLVEELIAAWAAADPDAAERWIATLDNANDRSHGLTALAETRLRADPAAAFAWANARLENPENPAIAQDFTLGFAATDPARTAQWAAALPEGDVKKQATVTLAAAWADTDAPRASQWAATLPPGAARDDAVTALGQVWSSLAPEEAVRWFGAQTFTSPDARFLAYRDFSQTLTVADAQAAERWIATLTEPDLADAALAGAAEATFDEAPDRAVLTAQKIKDVVTRATTVEELMKVWREDDPEAAESFAATHMAKPAKKP